MYNNDIETYYTTARSDDTTEAMLYNMKLALPLIFNYKSAIFISALRNTLLSFKKYKTNTISNLDQIVDFFYTRAQQFHAIGMSYGATVLNLADSSDVPLISKINPKDMLEAGPIWAQHLINIICDSEEEDAAVLAGWEYANITFVMDGYSQRAVDLYQQVFLNWNSLLINCYSRNDLATSLKLMLGFTLFKKGFPTYYPWELVKTYLISQPRLREMVDYLKGKGLNIDDIGRTIYTEATIPGGTRAFEGSELGRQLIQHSKELPGLLGFVSLDIISDGSEHLDLNNFHKMKSRFPG